MVHLLAKQKLPFTNGFHTNKHQSWLIVCSDSIYIYAHIYTYYIYILCTYSQRILWIFFDKTKTVFILPELSFTFAVNFFKGDIYIYAFIYAYNSLSPPSTPKMSEPAEKGKDYICFKRQASTLKAELKQLGSRTLHCRAELAQFWAHILPRVSRQGKQPMVLLSTSDQPAKKLSIQSNNKNGLHKWSR